MLAGQKESVVDSGDEHPSDDMGVCDVTASAIETDANMNSRRRHIAAPGLWDGLLGDSPPAELGLPSPTKFSPADDLSSVEPPSDAGTNHARLPSDAGTKHVTPSSDAGTKHATLPTVNGATLGRRDGLKEKGSVFRARIKWPDLVVQLFIHIGCLYGFYLFLYARLYTLIWGVVTSPVPPVPVLFLNRR
uniref:Uncharacterized protein n=1 Tax=Timema monikensis TaxID=170555 RepID=A0A7R9HS30_9NEOP|nr:unnamed protein product [Timema monikensis]